MEELLANATTADQLPQTLLAGLLLGGGVLAALVLAKHHRRNPPDRARLTEQMAARSWDTPQVVMLLGSLFSLYFLASFSGLFLPEEQIPLVQLLMTITIYSAIMGIVILINRRHGSGGFGLSRRRIRSILIVPVFYLALMPLLMLLTKGYHLILEHLFHMEIELQDMAQVITQDLSWLKVGYMLTAILIAPVYEELIFRGIVFPYFVKRIGLVKGAVLVSLLFAGMHYHIPSLVPLLVLSIALCLAYWRTGSLWVTMGMHIIFNAVSILALNMVR